PRGEGRGVAGRNSGKRREQMKRIVRHRLTPEEFDSLITCFLDAVSDLEDWDAEHPSWVITPGLNPIPSRKLVAEIRRRLPRFFAVLPNRKVPKGGENVRTSIARQ